MARDMTAMQRAVAWYLNVCDLAVMAFMLAVGLGAMLLWIALLTSPIWLLIIILYNLLIW